jgi:hypothetical protein
VENAAAGGELGMQVIERMERFDYQTRHKWRIGIDFETILAWTAEEQGAFDADKCRKRRAFAMRASGLDPRELFFYF